MRSGVAVARSARHTVVRAVTLDGRVHDYDATSYSLSPDGQRYMLFRDDMEVASLSFSAHSAVEVVEE